MSAHPIGGPATAPRDRLLDRRTLLLQGGLAAAGLALGGAEPSAAAPRRAVALIANSLSNTLTLVDGDTLEPFGTLPVGHEPHKFRVPPGGRTVYSCNTTSNELIQIDLGTLRPPFDVNLVDSGQAPGGIGEAATSCVCRR